MTGEHASGTEGTCRGWWRNRAAESWHSAPCCNSRECRESKNSAKLCKYASKAICHHMIRYYYIAGPVQGLRLKKWAGENRSCGCTDNMFVKSPPALDRNPLRLSIFQKSVSTLKTCRRQLWQEILVKANGTTLRLGNWTDEDFGCMRVHYY